MPSFAETGARIGISETQRPPAHSPSIMELPQLLERKLTEDERNKFSTLYTKVEHEKFPLEYITPEAREFVAGIVGRPVDAQECLYVYNPLLARGTLFNRERALRPLQTKDGNRLQKRARDNPPEKCTFELPDVRSPKDPLGPIIGDRSFTIGNFAPYYPVHSLVVSSKVHHPSDLKHADFSDMFAVSRKWGEVGNRKHPELDSLTIGMNLNARAGASIYHPHTHVILRKGIFQEMEELKRRLDTYKWLNEGKPYFYQLVDTLGAMDLVETMGDADVIHHLTPIKEREVIIRQREETNLPNQDLVDAIWQVIDWWRTKLNVTSLNLYVSTPPFGARVAKDSWFPPFARIVDRGSEDADTSDWGNMEMFGSSVVTADQFKLAHALREHRTQRRAA